MGPLYPAVSTGPCRPLRAFSAAGRTSIRGRQLRCWSHHSQPSTALGALGDFIARGSLQSLQKIGTSLSSFGLIASFAFGLLAEPVSAVTNEQLLFLEAWRAVDRAYYDKNFNGKPWFKIREQYLKEKSLNDRQETYAAIRSLLAQLDDPFTRFLEPSRYAALKRGTAGSLTGVGLEVGFDKDAGTDSPLVVITPSPGGPAEKAGIQPRDAVIAIDGKPTAGQSLYDAGELLQGAEGSQVTLSIQPHDGGAQRDVELARQRLTVNPVASQICRKVRWEAGSSQSEPEGSLGYIRVATFSKQTTDGVKTALHHLQSEGATRYVLDIRNNGGGLFPAGIDVARMLLSDGDIVLIADSQGVRDSYQATDTAVEPSAPLAVLVNKGTASASEVLAGALHDNGRGKIVGETTFGKGLIQTIVELSDGSGVAVTVARYQTPDGTDIDKKGIQPDIPIVSGSMPPTNGPGFCKFVASRGAAVMFDAKAAEAMSLDAPALDGGEQPVTVTEYENALPLSGVESEKPATPLEPSAPLEGGPTSTAPEDVQKSRDEFTENKSAEILS